jgi:hypothetical protein
LLHEVFGPLAFRTVALDPAWVAWNSGPIPKRAHGISDERAFDRLPVLADALEEAGCTDAQLLGQLRGTAPHALGCWALDIILAKDR